VPNPEVALDEFARVLKPVGEIVRLNRVGADAGPAACVRASVSAEMKVITDSPHDVQPSNDRKAGSAVTRSAFSIMAWAPSSRSKGSLWRNGNSPQELFLRTLRAVVRSLEIEQGPTDHHE
jgi:hypothetical protein